MPTIKKMNRATVRFAPEIVLEHLFGSDFAVRAGIRVDCMSVDQDGNLCLQVSGDPEKIPEGDAVAVLRSVVGIGGRITVFEGLEATK